jgi:uncharacterized RDD family membrane protein YckC
MATAEAVVGTTAEKVGFFPRVGATLIDMVILGVINAVLAMILPGDPTTGSMGLGSGLGSIVGIVYTIYFWSTTGQTIGHRALGLRVVTTDGSPMSIGKAIVRYLGLIVSFAAFGIGVLWVLWDGNKQGWHDKIAGTYVVKA